MRLDALILAGNRKDYIAVGNGNKALLDVGGRPLIEYVIDALETADQIKDIYIVGPVEDLSFLGKRHPSIKLMEQKDTLAENVLSSYGRICPDRDRHIFVTTSDIPFIQSGEVDDFIMSSGFASCDIVVGVAGASLLGRFLPYGHKPGIRNNCCHFRQGAVRLNNLFIMRAPSDTLTGYASTIYSARYQKRPHNFMRLMLDVLKRTPGSLRLIWTLLIMQATLQADRFALTGAAGFLGRLLDMHSAEAVASRAIGGRFKAVMMEYGGAALDIDNEEALNAARARFEEFMSIASESPVVKQLKPSEH